MELLLNIFWLALSVPAIWLWQSNRRRASRSGFNQGILGFVILTCVLMLLFPVVSASDDLHPMRPELEESSPFKRTVKQDAGTNPQIWLLALGFLTCCLLAMWAVPYRKMIAVVTLRTPSAPQVTVVRVRSPRAPPFPCCSLLNCA